MLSTLPRPAGATHCLPAPVDRPLELRLRHPRAPRDVQPLRLVVELLLRPPLRPVRPGAEAAPAPRREVAPRERGRGGGLALPRALLVDGSRGDLLRLL